MVQRESKRFWMNNQGVAVQTTGYACPPNEDMWWFPDLGFSVSGKCCYEKESEAKRVARKLCETMIETWSEKLENLKP